MNKQSEYTKRWREKDPERYLAYMRKWNKKNYQAHKKEKQEAARKYYYDHRNDAEWIAKQRAYKNAWYASEEGKKYMYEYKHRKSYMKKQRAWNRAWRENNPEKVKASKAISIALYHGKIAKKPCQICKEKKVEAHHNDYSRPLDIKWLCRKCHVKIHPHHKVVAKK